MENKLSHPMGKCVAHECGGSFMLPCGENKIACSLIHLMFCFEFMFGLNVLICVCFAIICLSMFCFAFIFDFDILDGQWLKCIRKFCALHVRCLFCIYVGFQWFSFLCL